MGLPGRRRDGRARVDGRHRPGRARAARQPHLRRERQPAAAGRPGARQRKDHPGAGGHVPGRGLERHQGDLGPALGPAAGARPERHLDAADDGSGRRRVPDVQEPRRRVRARALLQHARAEGDGRRLFRRGHLELEPRRSRPVQGVRRLPCGGEPQRSAHGHPGEDDQGLPDGRGRRGNEHRPSDQEAVSRGDPEDPRPLQPAGPRRQARGSAVPQVRGGIARARVHARPPPVPRRLPALAPSTTVVLVQILQMLARDKEIGKYVVPIVPDEARTFGMEGMFRQMGIWSHTGQKYTPQDAEQLMFYKEDRRGQFLEEGISEAGSMCDWIAAATSYSTHGTPMIPFFIFYSMFGFQRVGDFCWAAGDMRSRGFLIGGTSGRTTLNGEGLQHEDGHSHVLSSTVPNCLSYDPTFGYEVAVIVQDGLRRMHAEQQDTYYYVTVLNENYPHPAMPKGAAEGIVRGMYLFRRGEAGGKKTPRVQLLGSGAIFREVIAAADLLHSDFGIESDLWGCPSFTELAREGHATSRWNMLHPTEAPKRPYVTQLLQETEGPIIAATDYIRTFAEQIRAYVPRRYVVLGTDGYGRSDTREKLRRFFEVDRFHVAVAALKALADEGALPAAKVAEAIQKYGVEANRPPPWTV